MADLVAPRSKIRDFDTIVDAAPNTVGSGRQAANGLGDMPGEQHRKQHGDENRDEKGEQHGLALAAQDFVDLAALGREHQRAQNGTKALNGNRNGDDDLVFVVYAHDRYRGAIERSRDFGKLAAILEAVFRLTRVFVAEQPIIELLPKAQGKIFIVRLERRQFGLHDIAARIEPAAVDDEKPVAIVDATTNVGCRHEAAEHRAGTLGIDGKVQVIELIDSRSKPAVGTGLHQAIGIENDGIGIHRRRGSKSRRDDLALGEKALDTGVNEALTELIEI